jgi:hypothetical protein
MTPDQQHAAELEQARQAAIETLHELEADLIEAVTPYASRDVLARTKQVIRKRINASIATVQDKTADGDPREN